MALSRRDFIAATLLGPALAQLQPPAGGRLLGTVPFGRFGGRSTPIDRLLGDGLDARLFTDLSALREDALTIPSDRFFVRTAATAALPAAASWRIAMGGLIRQRAAIDLAALTQASRPAGRCLIECAGNADPSNYGLMSAADWGGVPVASLLERVEPAAAAHRILVAGFDDEGQRTRTSVAGASWIFSRDELREAFLATTMNGAALPRDHGAPVRLVVPGWYGCACIKWVNRIDLVPDDAPPTSQMAEYAGRTHQPFDSRGPGGSLRAGSPSLARDYLPAVIDTAAMPVRVERWSADGRIFYRVIGIVWGGETPTNALAIRFKAAGPWTPVERCPLPAGTRTWSLWTHTWTPEAGRYEIVLKVTDPKVRTRRLDLFYYVREITIEE